MTKIVSREQCPNCKDSSKDNLIRYDDGGGYCFACKYTVNKGNKLDSPYIAWRGITEATMKAYGVETKGGTLHFTYPNGATKMRPKDKKEFWWHGPAGDARLFGSDRFTAASAKAVTICEGELDALTVYQLLGSKYPAVSIRGASSSGVDCGGMRDYLNSFERIYLAFDSDEPGQDAVKVVSRIFDPNKVYHVQLSKYKDANEYLERGEGDAFVRAWWNARPFLPKGIVNDDDILSILKTEDQKTIASYPFNTLSTMAYGIRSGELVLFTAQQKVGKTEVLRAIEHHVLKTTSYNIGIIHLEEKEKRSVQGLASYELLTPTHLPDASVSADDVHAAYRKLAGKGRVFFYSHFGSDDPGVILDRIRYLVTVCGCKFIFLDHMTMLVSGEVDNNKRETLDMLATRFAMLTRELDFTLFLVCHVNDDGQPRDSRMIAKTCDMQVFLSRDKETSNDDVRNTVSLTLRDNRFGGITGPAGFLTFDPKSFTLREKIDAHPAEATFDFNL